MLPAILILTGEILFAGWLVWMLLQMRADGAPFWPSSRRRLETMLQLANIQPGDRVVDLGSGDGRVVIQTAQTGAQECVGYEIDPFWLRVSRAKSKRVPNADKIDFRDESFWDVDLSRFNVVFIYQHKPTMEKLAEKLNRDLKPGTRLISNALPLPDTFHGHLSQRQGRIYLYKKV
jgi:ubiquinone/menaquinone biosynthesis C-methylase UbiE